jgi:hypothetical protein
MNSFITSLIYGPNRNLGPTGGKPDSNRKMRKGQMRLPHIPSVTPVVAGWTPLPQPTPPRPIGLLHGYSMVYRQRGPGIYRINLRYPSGI